MVVMQGGGEALTEREQCYPEQTIDDILCEACGQDHSVCTRNPIRNLRPETCGKKFSVCTPSS